jgi:CRP-like cAMP-binding protein
VQPLQQMFDQLREHVLEKTQLTKEEFPLCTSFFVPKHLRKDQYLLEEGEPEKFLTFVTHGCLRAYSIDRKGEEHVVQFALEKWWISDLYAFLTGTNATLFIDALEDADLLMIDRASYEKVCTTVPQFERYFRILLQNNYIATHRRILASISLSAEEQYLQLLADYPDLVHRVALRHIASYLGITPEALSRIRSRLSHRAKR